MSEVHPLFKVGPQACLVLVMCRLRVFCQPCTSSLEHQAPCSHHLLLAGSSLGCHCYHVFPHDSSAFSNSFLHLHLFDQDSSNVVSGFLQDPYSTTFSSFSHMTYFFHGALQPHWERISSDAPLAPEDKPHLDWRSFQVWRWGVADSGAGTSGHKGSIGPPGATGPRSLGQEPGSSQG